MGIAQAISLNDLLAEAPHPQSAALRVYDALRKRIVEMDLPPDSTLSRSDIARDYAVSQTPVREAIQRLEQDGLVNIFPQSRTVVTRIDVTKLAENHFLRTAVETEVVRTLARAPDPALINRLRAILRMQSTLVGNIGEVSMFNELDETFHRTLFAGANQLDLHRLVKSRSGHLARARRLDLPMEGKMRKIVTGHTDVVDAIENGDPAKAEEAMRLHLHGTVNRLDVLRKEFAEFFTAPDG